MNPTLNIVTLRPGEIYVDLSDKRAKRRLYMIISINQATKTCRFLDLKNNIVTFDIPYIGLQLQQVS
jgi:hypothetical protein